MRRLLLAAVLLLAACNHHPGDAVQSVVLLRVGDGHCSGVAVSRDRVLTAAHCVHAGGVYPVTLHDGREVGSRVIAISDVADAALVEVHADLVPVEIASGVRAGDDVWIVSSPRGLGWSITRGVVSHTDRIIPEINGGRRVIQTDAGAHPGSSGGAVIDSRGRLVALLIGGSTDLAGYGVGLNLAVPIYDVIDLMQ